MARPQLHHTLTAAVEAVSPQAQSEIVVTEVELDLPLEIVAAEQRGRLLIAGTAPHSRWDCATALYMPSAVSHQTGPSTCWKSPRVQSAACARAC